jgi:hypothetical protein
LEKQALRFANRHLTPNQQDAALIRLALTHSPSHPLPPNDTDSHPFQDKEDISSFLSKNQPLLQPIGITPGPKGNGITQIFYENLTIISTNLSNNYKLQKTMGIIDDMEVDVFAFNEHKINFAHKENCRQGLTKIFHGGETLTRATGGSLKHPVARTLGKWMEGRTGMLAYGEIASLLSPELSGTDST